MLQKIRNMKKSRRGFTLVEIIVVLVILAILAAFTIPAMLGFVNDARSKAAIAQAREVYVAGQSAATEVAASAANTDGTARTLTETDAEAITNKITSMVTSDLSGMTIKVSVPVTATSKPPDKSTATVYVGADAKVYGVSFVDANGNGILLNSGGSTETYK